MSTTVESPEEVEAACAELLRALDVPGLLELDELPEEVVEIILGWSPELETCVLMMLAQKVVLDGRRFPTGLDVWAGRA
jgi:hypothetical protein